MIVTPASWDSRYDYTVIYPTGTFGWLSHANREWVFGRIERRQAASEQL